MKNVQLLFFFILIFISIFLGIFLLIRIDNATDDPSNEVGADDPDSGSVLIYDMVIPQAAAPEELVPDETVSDETIPDETVPDETIPGDTVPDITITDIAIPDKTVNSEKVSIGDSVYTIDPEQLEKDGIVIRSDLGIYTFLPGQWTADILINHIDLLDRSIAYTYNWFGIEQRSPTPVELDPRESVSGVGGYGNTSGIKLLSALANPPWLITHETVHYIELNEVFFDHGDVPIYLSEGLASALMYIQAADDYTYRSAFLKKNAGHIDAWHTLLEVILLLPDITVYPSGEIEPISLSKLSALYDISRMELSQSILPFSNGGLFISVAGMGSPNDRVDGFLYTYSTAASFSLFLLDYGSMDDYFKFYNNYKSAEDIYGKDLEALIYMWLHEYLSYDLAVPLIMDILED